jgi:probable O-glycosylation ligase (exosortase A-associated)
VLDLALTAFACLLLALGLRRPFVWVLAYIYVDVLAPQKISWFLLASVPISLILFVAAFGGWLAADDKRDSRFTLRQGLILVLLVYCGVTTLSADFPEAALAKWEWVWKALVFALFLPLTLRTRLRIEATALVMVLSAGAIIISGGIKTLGGGGGYGSLHLFVNDNTGLYEGSILSTVAIAIIPLVWWLARHGSIFPPDWRTRGFALALTFACLLIPIGTNARTGLVCAGLLALLALRQVKRRVLYLGVLGAVSLATVPFLPSDFTERMGTIRSHQADQSASTRVAVWKWTLEYVSENPFGGGFDAYRGNRLKIETRTVSGEANSRSVEVEEIYDQARAYHSSYFEMLGEQGWPGLLLWLWLMLAGLWQMEVIRRRWRGRTGQGEAWAAPLANALQLSQVVYMLGSLFVGIAFQPFCFMLIGLQCGLWSYLKRIESQRGRPEPAAAPAGLQLAVAAPQPALHNRS